MLKLADFRPKAKGLPDLVPYAALVAPGGILNKDGSLLAAWEVRGQDTASSTPDKLAYISAQVNQAVTLLGTGGARHMDAMRSSHRAYPVSEDLTGGIVPRVGDQHIVTLAIDGLPQESWPAMLADLEALPIQYRFSSLFLCLDQYDAAKEIDGYRKGLWPLCSYNPVLQQSCGPRQSGRPAYGERVRLGGGLAGISAGIAERDGDARQSQRHSYGLGQSAYRAGTHAVTHWFLSPSAIPFFERGLAALYGSRGNGAAFGRSHGQSVHGGVLCMWCLLAGLVLIGVLIYSVNFAHVGGEEERKTKKVDIVEEEKPLLMGEGKGLALQAPAGSGIIQTPAQMGQASL